MDTQHCLQCEFHKDRVDQDRCKYCYCFFTPDKGRWVAEIEICPKLGNHSGSSEIPNDLEEAAKAYVDDTNPTDSFYEAFKEGALWMREQMMKELSEKIASAYQLGLADKEKQMMKEAVEGTINNFPYPTIIELNKRIPTKEWYGQKVKLIIVKED